MDTVEFLWFKFKGGDKMCWELFDSLRDLFIIMGKLKQSEKSRFIYQRINNKIDLKKKNLRY